MKIMTVLAVLAASISATSVHADSETNSVSDAEKKAGWVSLFDGKTHDQWRGYRQKEGANGWSVKDGLLVGSGKGGDIITKQKFTSFELSLQWNISKGGNSGIMYKVVETKGPSYHSGPEYQLMDSSGKAATKTSAGANYALHTPAKNPTKPAGEWNTTRIIIKGNHIEHHMNGVKLLEYEIGSDDWKQRLAKSKFSKWPPYGKATAGHIALQAHGNPISFRNIKIREIK